MCLDVTSYWVNILLLSSQSQQISLFVHFGLGNVFFSVQCAQENVENSTIVKFTLCNLHPRYGSRLWRQIHKNKSYSLYRSRWQTGTCVLILCFFCVNQCLFVKCILYECEHRKYSSLVCSYIYIIYTCVLVWKLSSPSINWAYVTLIVK